MHTLNLLAQTFNTTTSQSNDMLVAGGALYSVLVIAIPILIAVLVILLLSVLVVLSTISGKMDTIKDIIELVNRRELDAVNTEIRAIDTQEKEKRAYVASLPETKRRQKILLIWVCATLVLLAILVILLNVL